MAEPLAIGRYLVFDAFARGGMATVHLARQTGAAGFSRVVAVKRMHQALAHDDELRQRFLREALVVARLRHPNIVPVLDVVSAGDELLLVMDYVFGVDLHELMRARQGPLEPPVAGAIVAAALRGLHAAHTATAAAGAPLAIVHRDVKPRNVLVGSEGVSTIADFGIARLPGVVTHTESVRGSFGYIAPEVLTRKPVDARADLWGAAIVLWEALTGQRLFHTDDTEATLAAILELPMEPPSAHAAGVSPALDEVVLRGLQRNPAARFASGAEMADALEAALETARPAQVGALVALLCGDLLRERRTRLQEVEAELERATEPFDSGGSRVGVRLPVTQPVTQPDLGLATDPTTHSTMRLQGVERSRSLLAVGAGAFAALAIGAAVAVALSASWMGPAPTTDVRGDGGTIDGVALTRPAIADGGSWPLAGSAGGGGGLAPDPSAPWGTPPDPRAPSGTPSDPRGIAEGGLGAGPPAGPLDARARDARPPRPPRPRPPPAPDCSDPFYPDPSDPRVLLPRKECMR